MPASPHAATAGVRRRWWPAALAMFAVGWGANQFAPMLLVYERDLGVSTSTATAMFGVYAVGLVPGLLLGGPASDRTGRRPLVLAFCAVSMLATCVLLVDRPAALFVARFLAGVASGVVFAAGSAWLVELSAGEGEGVGGRRAALALSAGFGIGPLVTGAVAQVADRPAQYPYLPHIALALAALALLPRSPDTRPAHAPGRGPLAGLRIAPQARRAFLRRTVPMAPWVFAGATISFGWLPGSVVGTTGRGAVAFAGLITFLTPGVGVVAGPIARRLGDRAALIGLLLTAAGLVLGAVAVAGHTRVLLFVTAPVLGTAYGLCLVAGLRDVERLAAPRERAGLLGILYAVTYTGFAAPYLLAVLGGTIGDATAALVAAGAAALTAAWVAAAPAEAGAG